MTDSQDQLSIATEEQKFLKKVMSIFPGEDISRSIIQGICAIFVDKLQESVTLYESRASDLSTQINSLKTLLSAEARKDNKELSNILMLLIQLRRLSHDHFMQLKVEISEAIKQAELDLKGSKIEPAEISSLEKLGEDILHKAPFATCMARSAAFDAVTAITAHVSNCVVLAFALHKFSVSIKERSLRLLAEDDQDSATLVLIERQTIINTIKTLVDNCSILTKVADWFNCEAEKELLHTISINDLRAPFAKRTAANIEADYKKSKCIKVCCEVFAACLDPNSVVHDEDKNRDWSFTGLSSLVATDSCYEALIKKVSGLNADLRKKRTLLSESLLSNNVEESAALTSEIARHEEKIANLLSFGHELHEELYMIPHGLEALTNRLSAGLLALRSVLLDLQDESLQACETLDSTEKRTGSFSRLAECYAKADTEKS